MRKKKPNNSLIILRILSYYYLFFYVGLQFHTFFKIPIRILWTNKFSFYHFILLLSVVITLHDILC